MRFLIVLSLIICFAASAAMAGEAGDVSGVSLTIYNDNLALIKELRPVGLESGTQSIVLPGVSGQLQPETVHLAVAGLDVELLEQNFDYDLVSRDKLLQKFIGKRILLVDDEHGQQFEGQLLSVAGGIVMDVDGRVLLNPPGRVVLPAGAVENLLLRPTLSWELWSPSAAESTAEITYLSGGLSWNADYVLMLNADDTAGDMEGWVTISNYSGTTYDNAELKLIAGDVNRVSRIGDLEGYDMAEEAVPMAAPAPAGFEEEAFFEYHLYDLQRPATLKNNQQKQIGLLTAADVPMSKLFIFHGQYGGDVQVKVEFTNDEESSMGMPLPAGTVRVFKEDSEGDAQFVGEDRIDHTPRDEDVRLYIGNAFDITGETIQTDYKDIGKGYTESYKVTLKNHKESEDVVVTVPINVWGDWEMLSSNYDYQLTDAFTAEFKVPVAAEDETTLEFAYKVVWK